MNGLAHLDVQNPDRMSYLLFDWAYKYTLEPIAIGYRDAGERIGEIEESSRAARAPG